MMQKIQTCFYVNLKSLITFLFLIFFIVSCGDNSQSAGKKSEQGSKNSEQDSKNTENETSDNPQGLTALDKLKLVTHLDLQDADSLSLEQVSGETSRTQRSGTHNKLFKLVNGKKLEVEYYRKEKKFNPEIGKTVDVATTVEITLPIVSIRAFGNNNHWIVSKFRRYYYGLEYKYPVLTRKIDGKAWLLPRGSGSFIQAANTNTIHYLFDGVLSEFKISDTGQVSSYTLTSSIRSFGKFGLKRATSITYTQEYLRHDSGYVKKYIESSDLSADLTKEDCDRGSGFITNPKGEGFLCNSQAKNRFFWNGGNSYYASTLDIINIKFDEKLEIASTSLFASLPVLNPDGSSYKSSFYLVNKALEHLQVVHNKTIVMRKPKSLLELAPTHRIVVFDDQNYYSSDLHSNTHFFQGAYYYIKTKSSSSSLETLHKVDITGATYKEEELYKFTNDYTETTFGEFQEGKFFFTGVLKKEGATQYAEIDLTAKNPRPKVKSQSSTQVIQVIELN